MSSFAPGSGGSPAFVDKWPAAYFDDAGIPVTIPFNPDAKPDNTLCYKHYNPSQVVLGKTMEEWLRFSVVYWHTFRGTGADPFGFPTLVRPWEDGSDTVENAKRRMRVAFEFFKRLGVKYYTFHDRDIAPEGATLAETNKNLDELADLAETLQRETGVKPLWVTCNFFANARFANGAATNPDAHVLAYAGAQLKKGLEIAKRLGAENYIFWGGREGYSTLLNTCLKTEMDNMANFFKMAVAYAKKIGFTGQFCIEPKPKEPTKHQYDYDAMTVIAFLKSYGLDKDFKVVIEQGGIAPGGLNFDCKVRRESTDVTDMFISHIGAMDTLARGLKIAARIHQEAIMPGLVKDRYSSYSTGFGKQLREGKATLEECDEFIAKNGNPLPVSGKQEHMESILNAYI